MSLLAALVFAAGAAVTPLSDAEQEQRAQALEREIRCVVCENEPISQSTADMALDMRNLVRERVEAGDSDAEIRAYFSERYGDFVLFRPPIDVRTAALWLAPLLFVALGLALAFQLRAGRGQRFEPEVLEDDR